LISVSTGEGTAGNPEAVVRVTMRDQILRWNPAACTGEAAWIAGRNAPLGPLNEVEDPPFLRASFKIPRRGGDRSSGVAGVEVRRGLLLSLRHHPCGIRLSRHTPWSEQFALQIVLGFPGLPIVDLRANFHAFVKYLSAGLQFPVRAFIAMACHWLILWLLEHIQKSCVIWMGRFPADYAACTAAATPKPHPADGGAVL
jgi:hypothetical protein